MCLVRTSIVGLMALKAEPRPYMESIFRKCVWFLGKLLYRDGIHAAKFISYRCPASRQREPRVATRAWGEAIYRRLTCVQSHHRSFGKKLPPWIFCLAPLALCYLVTQGNSWRQRERCLSEFTDEKWRAVNINTHRMCKYKDSWLAVYMERSKVGMNILGHLRSTLIHLSGPPRQGSRWDFREITFLWSCTLSSRWESSVAQRHVKQSIMIQAEISLILSALLLYPRGGIRVFVCQWGWAKSKQSRIGHDSTTLCQPLIGVAHTTGTRLQVEKWSRTFSPWTC